jgi:hypothetical protein
MVDVIIATYVGPFIAPEGASMRAMSMVQIRHNTRSHHKIPSSGWVMLQTIAAQARQSARTHAVVASVAVTLCVALLAFVIPRFQM